MPTELPDLIREFIEMARAYLEQETVAPAKRLGRFAAFSVGAALAFAFAALFLSVALGRFLIDLLPDGPYWSALGYLLGAVSLAIIAGIVFKVTQSRAKEVQV